MMFSSRMNIMMIACIIVICLAICASQTKPQSGGVKASVERGKMVYGRYCLTCHQSEGEGVPRLNPPLVKTRWVNGDKKELIKIVLNGLKGGEIEIGGNKFHNPMASHAFLKDEEVADVLTYIRKSFGNKSSQVRLTEVVAVRGAL